jgi:hypothetical protein
MTFDEQRWNEALIDRGQHAEEKYTRGEQVNDEDMLVMALLHPDMFEVQIRLRVN